MITADLIKLSALLLYTAGLYCLVLRKTWCWPFSLHEEGLTGHSVTLKGCFTHTGLTRLLCCGRTRVNLPQWTAVTLKAVHIGRCTGTDKSQGRERSKLFSQLHSALMNIKMALVKKDFQQQRMTVRLDLWQWRACYLRTVECFSVLWVNTVTQVT